MYEVGKNRIDRLQQGVDDVIVPSLPGFGFSQKPTETGWNVTRIATAWAELMKRLGYRNWVAQGGDWGSVVTSALGAMRPEGLLGIHLNSPYAFPARIPDRLSTEEHYAVDTLALYTGDMSGANHLQGTEPETIGFALADSPVGQAAWIYDKFQSKTDNNGLAEDALSTDEILDAISLYWFTNSAASSARIYCVITTGPEDASSRPLMSICGRDEVMAGGSG